MSRRRWRRPALSQRGRDAFVGGTVVLFASLLAVSIVVVAIAIVAAGARDIIAWVWS